ncbi:hypothetical protein DPSP01_014629 [Paraphaeosphaeria sporulosa]
MLTTFAASSFLRRVCKADKYDPETRSLAERILRSMINDENFVGWKPSFLAAGAYCSARFRLRKGYWTQAHIRYSGYELLQLISLPLVFYTMLEYENSHMHPVAVDDKYANIYDKDASIINNSGRHGQLFRFS